MSHDRDPFGQTSYHIHSFDKGKCRCGETLTGWQEKPYSPKLPLHLALLIRDVFEKIDELRADRTRLREIQGIAARVGMKQEGPSDGQEAK